ncbi:hypothetical protein [Bosea sp. BIWAKO-01]|uniref:hypothetical protein n=1 Tax=Bosea sp. BIWAKO-01 TaxID=506668 RepID=UPI000853C268|nr:hypothetical protein [Bosea sp. BIWAKO-01]GAU84417.1 hypothetical protein BIWAKO_04351 [Bosea sp. BIWAKO-01]
MQTIDEAPASIEFRANESRWEALVYVGFGGWIVYDMASKGGWTAVVGVALFGSLFLLLAFGKAVGEPDRSVHLAFDEEGLLVPRVFGRRLPWTAVHSYALETGSENGSTLRVYVTEPELYGPKPTGLWETWLTSSSALTGIRMSISRLACDEKDIEVAFQRFAPQVRRI